MAALMFAMTLSGCLGGGDDTVAESDAPEIIKEPLDNSTTNQTAENDTAPRPPPMYVWDIPELPTMIIDDTRYLYSDGPETLAMHVVVTEDFTFSPSSEAPYALIPVGDWDEASCSNSLSIVQGFPGAKTGATNLKAGEFILLSFGGEGTFLFTIGMDNSNPDSIWIVGIDDLVQFTTTDVQGRTDGLDAAWSDALSSNVEPVSLATVVYKAIDAPTEPDYAAKAGAPSITLDVNAGCAGGTWDSQPTPFPTLPEGVTFAWQGGPINATVDYSRDFDQGDHQLTIAAVTFTPI